MGVNQVNDDAQTHAMGLINKILEIIGRAGPGGDAIEAGYMVPKTSVVGVFLDGHELDDVVAGFFNFGKNFVSIVSILTHSTAFMSHADMRLVNSNISSFLI